MPDPNIRQYYTGGASRTDVDSGFPTIHPLTARDQLMALIDRESAQPRMEPPFRAAAMPRGGDVGRPMAPRLPSGQASMTRGGGGEGGMLRNVIPTWHAQQGAAMRPVGLGAQMIPGMAVDPRMLPPEMRPGSASFQNLAGPSSAGLESGPTGNAAPTSNQGFDYLTPLDQARYLAALRR